MGDLLDIFIYIYDSQLFINIMEGDGTNIQDENLEEGIVDYILYDVYSAGHIFDEFDLVASDGGMITLNQLAKEEFKNREEVIACVLDFIFEGKGSEVKYQIIDTEGAKKEWPIKKK